MLSTRSITPPVSRRQFLGSSARNAAGVAAGVVTIASPARASASDTVTLGVIGMRSRGRVLASAMAALKDAHIAAIADVDANQLQNASQEIENLQGSAPRWELDFRRILDDPSVDAVIIATPDHWHALMTIMACEANKDVYVEKPVSHNLFEGEVMMSVAANRQRVVQTGLQQRSIGHFQSAVEFVRSGQLGHVAFARAWTVHTRKPIGHARNARAPQGVNYDMWLGPAPARPFNRNRFHHTWRWFHDYGTGELGNWGVHMLDVARWGLNVKLPSRVSASGGNYQFCDDQEYPDTLVVHYSWPDCTIVWEHRQWSRRNMEGRNAGVAFYGESGTLIVDRSGWKVYDADRSVAVDAERLDNSAHCRNFIDAVRTRATPNADLTIGFTSTTLCHLGNIACRLGRELHLDGATPIFASDAEAGELAGREYRRQWDVNDYVDSVPRTT